MILFLLLNYDDFHYTHYSLNILLDLLYHIRIFFRCVLVNICIFSVPIFIDTENRNRALILGRIKGLSCLVHICPVFYVDTRQSDRYTVDSRFKKIKVTRLQLAIRKRDLGGIGAGTVFIVGGYFQRESHGSRMSYRQHDILGC